MTSIEAEDTWAARPENIYHCCVQKTGSQWIKRLMSDELIQKRSGMRLYPFEKHRPKKIAPWKLTERRFDRPFPINSIVSPLYLDFPGYKSIPKPGRYRTFFILRDPRDIVVSWYFSVRDSHPPIGDIPLHRERLQRLSLRDGLLYSMDYLDDFGIFEALRSWANFPSEDNLLLLRFEDLVELSRQFSVFENLFSHCRIDLSQDDLNYLLKKYSFDRLKKQDIERRKRSGIGEASAFRKGRPGDWKNYFDDDLSEYFAALTNSLAADLSYPN